MRKSAHRSPARHEPCLGDRLLRARRIRATRHARSQQLIYTSENLRMLLEEWERLWLLDQPSHLSPYHTHGGII